MASIGSSVGTWGRTAIGRIALSMMLCVLFAVYAASPASAAPGDLTSLGCVDDDLTSPDTCAESAPGLTGAFGIALSPDGRSLYVVSGADAAIVHFRRDPATGDLDFRQCINDDGVAGACSGNADGLTGAREVAVSPDGESVYATSPADNAIVQFDRDPATGDLTPLGCIEDNDVGPDTCTAGASANGLEGARGIVIPPDGNDVYVASDVDDALVHLARNPATGLLTPTSCIDDNDSGTDTCAATTNGLDTAFGVAASPNGASLYVTSSGDDAIVRFARTPDTGAVSALGCIDAVSFGLDTCASTAAGLDGARNAAVSPDGKSVYVAGLEADAVVRFDRAANGALTSQGCVGILPCAAAMPAFDGPRDVAVNPAGTSAYISLETHHAVQHLSRGATGAISAQGCVSDDDDGTPECGERGGGLGATGVATSPDGLFVYATAQADAAVAILATDGDGDDVGDFADACPNEPGAAPTGCQASPPEPGGGAPDTSPPDTTISEGPKAKTKSKSASFRFTSTEPGSSFECKLDGGPFEPCSSPEDVKVKKGKHSFSVRARDAAGNVDSTPATRDWTVKKKPKK